MSYASRWVMYRVNPDTWADERSFTGVTSGRVERSTDRPEIESGAVELADTGEDMADSYYKLVMESRDASGSKRVEVATLFCTDAQRTRESGYVKTSLTLSSVLYPASVMTVRDGTFLAAGSDAVAFCADLLGTAVSAPIVTRGSFALNRHVVFGGGVKVLDAVVSVLGAGGYRLRISENGTVTICPYDDEAIIVLDAAAKAFLDDSFRGSSNRAEIPNRVIAVLDGRRAEAVNDKTDSIVSTVSRGYYNDRYETSPQLADGEDLTGYVNRILEESSVLREQRTYTRDFVPDVCVGDVVLSGLMEADMDGSYRVVRQSISCGARLKVQETAMREVQLWQA